MAASHIFKVLFVNQGKVYEIYARKVSHGSLFGFIEVEELVFGERSTVVVDPAEEKIKAEFNEVKRTYLPMHSVLRIDEVKKQGVSKIVAREGSNGAQFPVPIYTPGGDSNARKEPHARWNDSCLAYSARRRCRNFASITACACCAGWTHASWRCPPAGCTSSMQRGPWPIPKAACSRRC